MARGAAQSCPALGAIPASSAAPNMLHAKATEAARLPGHPLKPSLPLPSPPGCQVPLCLAHFCSPTGLVTGCCGFLPPPGPPSIVPGVHLAHPRHHSLWSSPHPVLGETKGRTVRWAVLQGSLPLPRAACLCLGTHMGSTGDPGSERGRVRRAGCLPGIAAPANTLCLPLPVLPPDSETTRRAHGQCDRPPCQVPQGILRGPSAAGISPGP